VTSFARGKKQVLRFAQDDNACFDDKVWWMTKFGGRQNLLDDKLL